MTEQQANITWLGHATTLIETPEGSTFIIDPWLEDNPACSIAADDVESLDGIVFSHGHFDHTGDAQQLIETHQPQVVGIFEVATWFENRGAEHVVPMNEGGSFESDAMDVRLTAVHAQHSSALQDEDGNLVPGGISMGWVIDFSHGKTVYFSGDTNVFGDMQLIRELYEPDLALLPIGDHFTMGPREAAKAVELLEVDQVVPVHYGTFDVLTGTPDALREALSNTDAKKVLTVDPGQSVQL